LISCNKAVRVYITTHPGRLYRETEVVLPKMS